MFLCARAQSQELFKCRPYPAMAGFALKCKRNPFSGSDSITMNRITMFTHATRNNEWCDALVNVSGIKPCAALVADVDINTLAASIKHLNRGDVSNEFIILLC